MCSTGQASRKWHRAFRSYRQWLWPQDPPWGCTTFDGSMYLRSTDSGIAPTRGRIWCWLETLRFFGFLCIFWNLHGIQPGSCMELNPDPTWRSTWSLHGSQSGSTWLSKGPPRPCLGYEGQPCTPVWPTWTIGHRQPVEANPPKWLK